MHNCDNYSHEYKTRRILDLDKILLFLEFLWTLIMQMTVLDEDPTWDSVSSSIWFASFGIQRDRQLWKVQLFGTEFVMMKQVMEVSQGL